MVGGVPLRLRAGYGASATQAVVLCGAGSPAAATLTRAADARNPRALYGRDWSVELLERRPIPPGHPGYVDGSGDLQTCAWRLERTP